MSWRTWMAALTAAAVCGMGAEEAGAAIITVNFAGTVGGEVPSGPLIDDTGIFGAAGANLSGASFTATTVFDTTLGALISTPGGRGIVGGNLTGFVPDNTYSSPGRGSITINGQTLNYSGSFGSALFMVSDTAGNVAFLSWVADGVLGNLVGLQFVSRMDPNLPTSLASNFSGAFCAVNCGSVFDLGPLPLPRGFLNSTRMILTVDGAFIEPPAGPPMPFVPVSPPPASVPEPSTWMLMILGLGALGVRLRWRGLERMPRRRGPKPRAPAADQEALFRTVSP